MGTVLQLLTAKAGVKSLAPLFQSPFSMGTVLHRRVSVISPTGLRRVSVPLLDGDGVAILENAGTVMELLQSVSVPFSMGTVLHLLLNSHVLQHLQRVREAFSSRVRFLRQTLICEFCRYHTSPQ